MKHNIDLSIVIVSYNTKDLLIDCINSILQTAKKSKYEVIVVDNASVDRSVEEVKKVFATNKNVRVIANKQNVGFSKANNIGVKKSIGRYVLFLNPDTVVFHKTLDGLVIFMDSYKDAGAATCFVILPNKKLDDAAHRGFPTPWRAFSHFSGLSKLLPHSKLFGGYSLGWMDLSKTHEVEACAGAFMMVRREAGESIGWWDEDYFWYGEDLDFCYRLKNGLSLRAQRGDLQSNKIATSPTALRNDNNGNKWKIYFVPGFRILHYKGVSGGIKKESKHISTADSETKLRATKARFEAMKIFYRKHYEDKYPAFISWLVVVGINTKLLVTKKLQSA